MSKSAKLFTTLVAILVLGAAIFLSVEYWRGGEASLLSKKPKLSTPPSLQQVATIFMNVGQQQFASGTTGLSQSGPSGPLGAPGEESQYRRASWFGDEEQRWYHGSDAPDDESETGGCFTGGFVPEGGPAWGWSFGDSMRFHECEEEFEFWRAGYTPPPPDPGQGHFGAWRDWASRGDEDEFYDSAGQEEWWYFHRSTLGAFRNDLPHWGWYFDMMFAHGEWGESWHRNAWEAFMNFWNQYFGQNDWENFNNYIRANYGPSLPYFDYYNDWRSEHPFGG